MLDKALVKKHFSRHAKEYDRYADVQADMAVTLMDLLNGAISNGADRFARFEGSIRILEIGCGTGRLTVELLRRFPGAALTAVDLAPEMIELARQRVNADCGSPAVRTRQIREDEGAAQAKNSSANGERMDTGDNRAAHASNEDAGQTGDGKGACCPDEGAVLSVDGMAVHVANEGAGQAGDGRAANASARNISGTVPADRIQWIVGDAENDAFMEGLSGRSFDLIVSGATFQWFIDPASMIRRLASLLKPGGLLAFSTFGPQTFRELRESFRQAERELGLPAVPHGQTFPSGGCWDRWAGAAEEKGGLASTSDRRGPSGGTGTERTMRKTSELEQLCVKTYPSVRAFLHHVKKMGAQNAVSATAVAADAAPFSHDPGANQPDPPDNPSTIPMTRPGRGLGGRRLLYRMEAVYAETFRREGESGIPATYHLIYKIYQKA